MNELTQYKQSLQQQIKLAQSINKLLVNSDFVLVFKNYYCHDLVLELTRNLTLYADDSLEYKETLKQLHEISSFQKFISTIQSNGAMAKDALLEVEAIPVGELDD